MLTATLIIGLIVFAFIVNRFRSSELIVTIMVLVVLFFCILNYYYSNTESAPQDLYNENVKRMRKKQHLNDAFDALLNKNNSSIE
ncbi:ORF107 similar to AcMNPV ORF76 [Cydia pomonella granulovirus]|uniref:ORF107 n=2 Tax=Cydia pomonella granulosis virus TaxID=28289 RepID=A0A097P1Z8_GVCP|nr:ORF107 similar to AcMNPV ORF76 [Cydia pomonella granulovirus]AAK70767.1 ORF107 similar to AcMNPV ORF76 [Cydia pomonella granulovirus]AIU36754.1 ORF107 [Cydia pomonella granulovirus]AIU36890.1 ORF107 [Cydia pomonella granulovirus]AIU37033.1 ORF107 [Cydia pomonella granulovirus]AIU37175.1 ORF107 [Cydia pomonella granulovirus]